MGSGDESGVPQTVSTDTRVLMTRRLPGKQKKCQYHGSRKSRISSMSVAQGFV
jgi:hypothetical protein